MVSATDPQAVVITARDLHLIHSSLKGIDGQSEGRNQQRERLHQMSEARAKTWGNTLDALRKKKEDERQRRKELEEAELMKIDKEEKGFRNKTRQAALKRAEKIFYESRDQVRSFRSKLMLTDVIAEREATSRFKSKKEEIIKKRDQQYYEHMMRELEKANVAEEEKARKVHEKNKQVKVVLDEQLSEYREKQRQRDLQRAQEAERLQKMHEEDIERAHLRQVEKHERAKQMTRDLVEMNEDMKRIKVKLQAAEDAKDAKIQVYAAEKAKKKRLRREQEEERFAEKQRVQQKLIDEQTAYLEKMQAGVEERVEAQVKEAAEKKEAEESAKAAKKEKLRRECEEVCNAQLARRKRMKTEAIENERAMLRALEKKLEAQERQEAERRRKARGTAIDTETYVKTQIRQKRVRDRSERVADREYQLGVLAKDADVERRIQENAEAIIQEYRAKGRDPTALLLELNKPDRLPNVW